VTDNGRCIRFRRSLIARLPGLLHMRYRIHELASELGTEPRQIRRYLSYGAPCETDDAGVWVVGSAFHDWVNDIQVSRKNVLEPDQAYCLRCNAPRQMVGPISTFEVHKTRFQVQTGKCAVCGAKVTRGQSGSKNRD